MELIKTAEKAFYQLVDRFYRENEDRMAPQQHEAAKKDFEYFMRLVDLAVAFYWDSKDGFSQTDFSTGYLMRG